MERKTHYLLIVIAILITACSKPNAQQTADSAKPIPCFSADSAYMYVENQTIFGPRVPGTQAHALCAFYLEQCLRKTGAAVTIQEAVVPVATGERLPLFNITASFSPENPRRLLLCAHYDSRPWCDAQTDSLAGNSAVLGAGDGASGVGVLLELSRLLSQHQAPIGIDIVLLDVEDYGLPKVDNSFCVGSQYWSTHLNASSPKPYAGILLDMVGAPDAVFYKDAVSQHYAPAIVNEIWDLAAQKGYGGYFRNQEGGMLIDDHYYINRLADIPCVDIIHFDPATGFPWWWHTTHDTMENVSKQTLQAVGDVLTSYVFTR